MPKVVKQEEEGGSIAEIPWLSCWCRGDAEVLRF